LQQMRGEIKMSNKRSRAVLLPVTFAPSSLEWASHAATSSFVTDQACCVHVLSPLSPMNPGVVWNSITDDIRIRHTKAQLRQELVRRGVPNPQVIATVGSPGAKICEVAKQEKSELIALPTHGRKGMQRWLLGSVAEDVVRSAPCEVLVSKFPGSTLLPNHSSRGTSTDHTVASSLAT
jgi:nucleotide-binding universal stress UspA family protein